ncbi:MAG: hypothetical protein ACXADW_08650 [Candidatus Hodarchaeales archaeon]|jgi:hypothetical protein
MGNESLPTPGQFVTNELVNLYGTTIDQIIADFGRTMTIYLPPSTSGCPNCDKGFDGSSQGIVQTSNVFPVGSPFNRPFPQGGVCPVCQGTHKIEIPRTAQYTFTILRAPKDFNYTQYGKDIEPANVVQTKTVLASFNDVKNAIKVLIDGDLYNPLRYPLKTGLRDLRYVKMWWLRIDK